MPDTPIITDVFILRDKYDDFLTEKVWKEIQSYFHDYKATLSGELISQSRKLVDNKQLRHAFIEGVCALELALNEFVTDRTAKINLRQNKIVKNKNDDLKKSSIGRLRDMPLPSQVIIVAAMLESTDSESVQATIDVIELRNKIVHEGFTPDIKTVTLLEGMFRLISTMLPKPQFLFPKLTGHNRLYRKPKSK